LTLYIYSAIIVYYKKGGAKMSKQVRAIFSMTLLLVVLLVAFFSIMESHSHCCEQVLCLQCELVRNVNDGILTMLILLVGVVLATLFIASALMHIIIECKGRALSPTKLMVKLLD
jgi:hypothetical protein